MKAAHAWLIFCAILLMSPLVVSGQNDWSSPWILVGDSLDLDERTKVVVTGRILDHATGEPIVGAAVSIDGFKYFDHTDKNGSYLLELLPGSYRLKVSHLGWIPKYLRVRIVSKAHLDVRLQEGYVQLNEVVITARAIDSNVKEALAGLTKLNIQEVKTLPTLMGEVDIVKTLQLMPGVTSVGEGSAGFNVRGGRVDQNLVLLNDMPIFNTSHALGFVSAFNQDIIDNFSLYKGNVPANFGGRASSVLEINSRRGDFQKWKFQGGIGPVTSRLSLEGPLVKNKTSILATARVSHVGWVLKKVKDPDVKNSSAGFNDLFLSINHRFSENSLFDFSAYNSSDNLIFSDKFGYDWKNTVVNGKWQALANRKASPIVNLSYGRYKSMLIDPSGIDASQLTNVMNYFQLKPYVNYAIADDYNVVAGFSAIAYLPRAEKFTGYGGNSYVGNKQANKDRGVEVSAFVNSEIKVSEKIAFTIGIRYSHYTQLGADTVFRYAPQSSRNLESIVDTMVYQRNQSIQNYGGFEPRISARFSLTEKQSIKVGYNRMRQYIHLISNTTAPTPVDLWQVSNQFLPPQVADNYSLGYFLNLHDNRFETSVEVFYKDMKNIVEYKDFPKLYVNSHLETELLSGIGRAYGSELYVRKLKGNWTGWISYTYSQTRTQVASAIADESVNNGRWYASSYNRPHNLNVVLNRALRHNGALSAIFSYTTGRPFTAIESSYIVGTTVVPIYSDRNKYQIPNYIRLDLSFTAGNVFRKINDSLVFSIYNFLGRNNAYSVFYFRPAPTFKIPKPYKLSVLGAAFPSISYNFKF